MKIKFSFIIKIEKIAFLSGQCNVASTNFYSGARIVKWIRGCGAINLVCVVVILVI